MLVFINYIILQCCVTVAFVGLMKEKGEKSSYWKEIYYSLIPWRKILQMKTRKFIIAIRYLCVFFPRRNMKPLSGVSLRSEKFGGEFKSFRYYICSLRSLTKSTTTIVFYSYYRNIAVKVSLLIRQNYLFNGLTPLYMFVLHETESDCG